MNNAVVGKIWNQLFEYDRRAEKKIISVVRLWNSNQFLKQAYAMFKYNRIRKRYNCSINPRISLGKNLYISHAQDIIIGQTAVIGDNCKVYPGAKVIAKVIGDEKLVEQNIRRHPKIGDNCILGADCLIIGPITIGNNVVIGAGAICTKDVTDNSIVTGINQIRRI